VDEPLSHPVLKAAEAKLRHAFEDLHALRTNRAAFLKACADPLTVEFDRGSGWWIAKIGVVEEPPPDLSVLVGDIAYQCLSAFNHIVWELAARKIGRRRITDKRIREHVQVPVAHSSSVS
jgi:hypothetical protein